MAQFDIHRLSSGDLVVDCQSEFVDSLHTRLAVPLVDPQSVPGPLARLHPQFVVGGERVLFAAHLASAISCNEMGPVVGSLSDHYLEIIGAFDFLLTGV